MKNAKNNYGERLRNILKEKNMPQRALAKKTGITEATVSNYINGKQLPKLGIIEKIALALDVKTDYLLGLSDTRNDQKELVQDQIKKGEELANRWYGSLASSFSGTDEIDENQRAETDEILFQHGERMIVTLKKETKEQFGKFCNESGLTTVSAIKLFINKVVRDQKIPTEIIKEKEKELQESGWIDIITGLRCYDVPEDEVGEPVSDENTESDFPTTTQDAKNETDKSKKKK